MRTKQRPSRYGSNQRPLPEGWLRWFDEETGQHYYEDNEGNVTWDDPTRWRLGQWLLGSDDKTDEETEDDDDEPFAVTIEHAFAEWCHGAVERKSSEDSDEDEEVKAAVTLHVYDVKFRGAGFVNSLFRPVAMGGAYHTGIEVHGREWSFGATTDECGIFACKPMKCRPHTFRESISLGTTTRSEVAVFNALLQLAPFWWGPTYDLLRKNCNSFCIVFAGVLGADPLPEWIHSLGDNAAELDDRARRVFATLNQRSSSGGGLEDDDKDEAAVVSNNHGKWRVDRFSSYAEAKRRYNDLPLRHASVLFLHSQNHWTAKHTYGFPSAVARIKDRFLPDGVLKQLDFHDDDDTSSLWPASFSPSTTTTTPRHRLSSSSDPADMSPRRHASTVSPRDGGGGPGSTDSSRSTPILRPHRPPLARTSLILA